MNLMKKAIILAAVGAVCVMVQPNNTQILAQTVSSSTENANGVVTIEQGDLNKYYDGQEVWLDYIITMNMNSTTYSITETAHVSPVWYLKVKLTDKEYTYNSEQDILNEDGKTYWSKMNRIPVDIGEYMLILEVENGSYQEMSYDSASYVQKFQIKKDETAQSADSISNKAVTDVVENKSGTFSTKSGKLIKSAIVQTSNGTKYIVGDKGYKLENTLVTTVEGAKYYTNSNGAVVTDKVVKLQNGTLYYATANGKFAVNKLVTTKSGVKYFASTNGKLVKNQFVKTESGAKYYAGSDGKFAMNKIVTVSGAKYYAASTGKIATSKIVTVNGAKYYATSSGKFAVSKIVTVSGAKYYAASTGKFATSKWVTVGKTKYYCSKNGKITKTK